MTSTSSSRRAPRNEEGRRSALQLNAGSRRLLCSSESGLNSKDASGEGGPRFSVCSARSRTKQKGGRKRAKRARRSRDLGGARACQGWGIGATSVSRKPRSSSTEPMGCVSTPHRLVEPIARERVPPADGLVAAAVSWPKLPRLSPRPEVQVGIAVELDDAAHVDKPCGMPGGSRAPDSCSFGLSLSV